VTNYDKTKLRAIYLKKRLLLPPDEIRQKSRQISEKILHSKQIETSKVIACYLAINKEPDLDDAINQFLKIQKAIVVPAFFKTSKNYKFVKLSSFENLNIGPYKIPQPSKLLPVDSIKIDLVLLPGLAFSEGGLRLGYGKGVYDKLTANTNALKIGVCFDFQVIDNFNAESHDLRVDFIITEKRIIKTRNF
jgi:5-formyltetrahydrofolate cyclo-ligase